MTRPIGRDKVKAVAWKWKGKEVSTSQSEYSSTVGGIMSTLKKLSNPFGKALRLIEIDL
jgi:hypothetical protein